jgi:hypothetical protein
MADRRATAAIEYLQQSLDDAEVRKHLERGFEAIRRPERAPSHQAPQATPAAASAARGGDVIRTRGRRRTRIPTDGAPSGRSRTAGNLG